MNYIIDEKDDDYAIYKGEKVHLSRVVDCDGIYIIITDKRMIDDKCFEYNGEIKRRITGKEVEAVIGVEHFAILNGKEYQYFYQGGDKIKLWVSNGEEDKEICDKYGRRMVAPGEYYVVVPLNEVQICMKKTYYDKNKYIDKNKAVVIKEEKGLVENP